MLGCIDTPSQPIIMGNLLVIHNAALGSSRSSVSLSFILSSQSVSVQVLTLPRKQFWHWNNNLSSLVVYQIPVWPFVVTFLSAVWCMINKSAGSLSAPPAPGPSVSRPVTLNTPPLLCLRRTTLSPTSTCKADYKSNCAMAFLIFNCLLLATTSNGLKWVTCRLLHLASFSKILLCMWFSKSKCVVQFYVASKIATEKQSINTDYRVTKGLQ